MFIEDSFYFGWFCYNLLNMSLMCLVLYNYRIKILPNNLFIGLYCAIVFILAFAGNSITQDHEPYKIIVDTILSTRNPFVHVEPFWIYFIRYVCGSYSNYLFILSLLLSSFLFINIQILKPRNIIVFLGIFSSLSLYGFIGGRQGLFTMLFTLGLCLLGKRKWFMGLCVIFVSIVIHKVGFIAVLILLFCLIPTNDKRTVYIISFIIIGAIIMRNLIMNNVDAIFIALDNAPGSSYLINEEDPNSTGSVLWKYIPYFRTILLFVIGISMIIKLNPSVKFLSLMDLIFYRFMFWCIIISGGLYLINLPDPTIASRTFSLMLLPFAYMLSNLGKYIDKLYCYQIIVIITIATSLLINNLYIFRVGLAIAL